ncbi:hypothetical protein PanWU01x14_356060 [Parasponia andersonii]|uniref:Transmembrane protein n=1 Tax=Parasponia andersonii TaxID=3476 RepID=A0A2P5A925_PARAD|nr:hypothetical protein PanWU01x14_356060 [Parasponia andersonii]
MLAAAAAASSSSSWLRSRRIRYLFLFLCSPILLPFLCATFPLLCAAELCLRLCRRRRRRDQRKIADDSEDDDRLRRCEEGCCYGGRAGLAGEGEEVGLLQRYLEDQLVLVGSMYDCGEDVDGDGEIEEGFDSGLLPSRGNDDGDSRITTPLLN